MKYLLFSLLAVLGLASVSEANGGRRAVVVRGNGFVRTPFFRGGNFFHNRAVFRVNTFAFAPRYNYGFTPFSYGYAPSVAVPFAVPYAVPSYAPAPCPAPVPAFPAPSYDAPPPMPYAPAYAPCPASVAVAPVVSAFAFTPSCNVGYAAHAVGVNYANAFHGRGVFFNKGLTGFRAPVFRFRR